MKTGNKGEWSELYVLFYVLAKGQMSVARGENATRDPAAFLPVLAAYRNEPGYSLTLAIKDNTVEITATNGESRTIDRVVLDRESMDLYRSIVDNQDKNGAFSVPSSEELMRKMMIEQIKAKAEDKTDIVLKIHDFMTSLDSKCAFSIKSNLGGNPTLLNPSKPTNFIYEVKNLTENDMEEINSIEGSNKVIKRMQEILDRGGAVSFVKMYNDTFRQNLCMIDSQFPELMSKLLIYYFFQRSKFCKTAIAQAAKEDIMGYGNQYIYEYKFKLFLLAVALGMKPKTPWDGQDEANSGYIIVKEDGDVLAYYLYNRNDFASYLFNNTRFETPSTKRYDYAKLYIKDEKMYLNLNLDIRFI